MKEHSTLKDRFTWVPVHQRKSRFGGDMPPRKPDHRQPLLWLARDDGDLYLVNASEETLDYVIADGGGFLTADDEVVTTSNQEHYRYEQVAPGDAVKVEHYDGMFDRDFVLGVSIEVKSKRLGRIFLSPPPDKGGVGEIVLLWDTGEPGKNVSVTNS